MGKAKKVRINLELTPDVARRLRRLQASSQCATRTETIRKALATLEQLVSCTKDGGEVILRHSDSTEQRLLI